MGFMTMKFACVLAGAQAFAVQGTYHCTIMIDGQRKSVNKIIVQH
jgi:hypothetical protein